MTLNRIVQEGYGENAWHGANLKTALADVTPELAFLAAGTGSAQHRRNCPAPRVVREVGSRSVVVTAGGTVLARRGGLVSGVGT